MKEQDKQEKEFDEIDLVDIKRATVSLLDTIGFLAYKTIRYIVGKWMYLVLGLLLGFVLGYVKYRGHQHLLQTAEISAGGGEYAIIVAPKYNSMDYLDQLAQANFSDKLGYTQIKEVKIEGLASVFSFLSQDSLYVKIYEHLAAKEETAGEMINNYAVSKNYAYQLMRIKFDQPFNVETFITDLQQHFNQHPYFSQRKQIESQTLALEKEALEEELKGLSSVALLENKTGESKQYLTVLARKKEVISRLNQIQLAQLENKEVLFVLDYVAQDMVLMGRKVDTIEKQIAKNIAKCMLLFFVVGMGIDFVRYYKSKV
ncbi:hypothetical protein ACPDHL_05120 [Myroides sp. C15-4]|uniref:hypothetical protein n=1 Tax=Myroides sp. C15-4 TaxID=3400532 RepID=UPI003D2F6308